MEIDAEDCELLAKRLGFTIDSFTQIDKIQNREKCSKCARARMYFCYDCRLYTEQISKIAPKVELPVQIDIIKHWLERNGKSTAVHSALTAPHQTRIFDSFEDVPDYSSSPNTVIVYPSNSAYTIDSYVEKFGPIKRFIFLDSTWWTVGRIRNLNQLKNVPNVILKTYKTQYWRPQKGYSDEYLATIEAIYYAIKENFEASARFGHSNPRSEMLESINSTTTYNGQYDNLLFWFFYFRSKVAPEKRKNNR